MFRITGHKGFQMTFANGCTVSVQFGPGNYSDHHGNTDYYAPRNAQGLWESETAEVAAWDSQGRWHDFGDEQALAYVSPDAVVDFIARVKERGVTPRFAPPGSRAESVMFWRPEE